MPTRPRSLTDAVSHAFFKYGIFLPVVALRGERVFHYLQALEASQWLPPPELEKIQDAKLGALLQQARVSVPFYRERLADTPARGLPRESLSRAPLLTKLDLIHRNNDLRSTTHTGPVTTKTTGGSTGQTVTVRKSRNATALEQAANWRGFRWEGIDIGDPQGRFWGVPADDRSRARARLIDWIAHRRRYSAFRFTPEDLASYLADLARFKPRYLYGYVSMLRCVAEYLVATGRTFPADLCAVVTTSEPLTTPDRELFQRAFAAPVFNEYGCGELGTIAHECEKHTLHIHVENLLVEILDPVTLQPTQGPGEIVVTELNNHAMPLIRYRLGDFAALANDSCSCGRQLPALVNVFGRAYDMIRSSDGRQFHGEFFMYIFEDARRQGLGVDAFQVIQNDYRNLTVKVVPGAAFDERSERFIRDRIIDGMGTGTEVTLERVDAIPRAASGKLRLVIGMDAAQTRP